MSKHFQRNLSDLKRQLLQMGALVEEAINLAIQAVVDREPKLGRKVVEGDRQIDKMEIDVEEHCLMLLALHQPVAADLRFIVAVMKVNNDLERMGDLAKNIANRAVDLARVEPLQAPDLLRSMVERAREMVRNSLDSLVYLNQELARQVCRDDDLVDTLHEKIFSTLQADMGRRPEVIPPALDFLSISRHLERIADLATNIAEDVVFMIEGEVIRHRAQEEENPGQE